MSVLHGSEILVTGGTGSFGKAFVRYALDHLDPHRLIIFSRDELKQFEMGIGLSVDSYPCLRYFIGDVRDSERLNMALREVDVVVHEGGVRLGPEVLRVVEARPGGEAGQPQQQVRERLEPLVAGSSQNG